MSRIDDFQKTRSQNTRGIEYLNLSLGRDKDGNPDEQHNDKACFRFWDRKTGDSDATIYLSAGYGYYGSSSWYSSMDANIREYTIRALNAYSKKIAEHAMKLMQDDIEKARKDAEAEALDVLNQVKK
jgi:hypothetical protein